jgi:tetratricopeptide (TPR) repeat protein
VAGCLANIGAIYSDQGDLSNALKFYRDSLALAEKISQVKSQTPDFQARLADLNDWIGEVLERQGDLPEAMKFYNRSLAYSQKMAEGHEEERANKAQLVTSYVRIGNIFLKQGDTERAYDAFKSSFDAIDRALAHEAVPTDKLVNEIVVIWRLASVNDRNSALQRIDATLRALNAQDRLSKTEHTWRLEIQTRLSKQEPNVRPEN